MSKIFYFADNGSVFHRHILFSCNANFFFFYLHKSIDLLYIVYYNKLPYNRSSIGFLKKANSQSQLKIHQRRMPCQLQRKKQQVGKPPQKRKRLRERKPRQKRKRLQGKPLQERRLQKRNPSPKKRLQKRNRLQKRKRLREKRSSQYLPPRIKKQRGNDHFEIFSGGHCLSVFAMQ